MIHGCHPRLSTTIGSNGAFFSFCHFPHISLLPITCQNLTNLFVLSTFTLCFPLAWMFSHWQRLKYRPVAGRPVREFVLILYESLGISRGYILSIRGVLKPTADAMLHVSLPPFVTPCVPYRRIQYALPLGRRRQEADPHTGASSAYPLSRRPRSHEVPMAVASRGHIILCHQRNGTCGLVSEATYI